MSESEAHVRAQLLCTSNFKSVNACGYCANASYAWARRYNAFTFAPSSSRALLQSCIRHTKTKGNLRLSASCGKGLHCKKVRLPEYTARIVESSSSTRRGWPVSQHAAPVLLRSVALKLRQRLPSTLLWLPHTGSACTQNPRNVIISNRCTAQYQEMDSLEELVALVLQLRELLDLAAHRCLSLSAAACRMQHEHTHIYTTHA